MSHQRLKRIIFQEQVSNSKSCWSSCGLSAGRFPSFREIGFPCSPAGWWTVCGSVIHHTTGSRVFIKACELLTSPGVPECQAHFSSPFHSLKMSWSNHAGGTFWIDPRHLVTPLLMTSCLFCAPPLRFDGTSSWLLPGGGTTEFPWYFIYSRRAVLL